MSKIAQYGSDAVNAVVRGVDFLVDAVALTEGPRGRNVILGQRAMGQTPKCTRDGVTVANYTDPFDTTEQMGADLIREACQKTDNAVGDGTTCTAVLSRAMIHMGFDLIQISSANPMGMERGIHRATDAVISHLKKIAVPATGDRIFQVATVSAHGDEEIGRLVSNAIDAAGPDGVITVEPSSTSDTYVQTVAGLELPKSSLLHSAFITHPDDMKAELSDCRILLWEGVISTAKSIVPLLQQVSDAKGLMPLLIVAGGYEAEVLACIIKNKMQAGLPIIAVRMEAYGERRKEVMHDIAALIGGKAYTEDMGLRIENVKLSELGRAGKVVTTMSKTQIIGGKGNQEELAGRVRFIRDSMDEAAPAEKRGFKTRLAALLGGITVIKVGGTTVTEMEEKKDRIVDAVSAAKAALECGIVPGGGVALLRAAEVLGTLRLPESESSGVRVVREACLSVIKQIAMNAGVDPHLVVAQSMATTDLGFNAATGNFENLIETGIVDALKVIIESIRNAAAVSCTILTMGACIAEKPTGGKKNV